MANNLAYYVDGGKNYVTQAKLVLNVNNKSQATSAHHSLLISTEVLSEKITGVKLPQSIKQVILDGKQIKSILGKTDVEVKRDT